MIQLKKAFEAALETDALRSMDARLREGCRLLTVAGLAGGAKPLAVARAILTERRPAAALTASEGEAQTLVQDLRFLLGLLIKDPPEVIHLPSLEVDPYRGLSPHPEIAAARSLALWKVLQDEPVILVASVRAAAVRLHSPQRFLASCLELKQGDSFAPEQGRAQLQQAGYVEDDPVTEPGESSEILAPTQPVGPVPDETSPGPNERPKAPGWGREEGLLNACRESAGEASAMLRGICRYH